MFFQKLFAPWTAAAGFADEAAWHGYLMQYNKVLNVLRVIFLVVAFAFMVIYIFTDQERFRYVFIGVILPAIPITLVIGKNEKTLPEELRTK